LKFGSDEDADPPRSRRAAARMVAVAAVCDCRVGLCKGARRAGICAAARQIGIRSAVIDTPLQRMVFDGDFFG